MPVRNKNTHIEKEREKKNPNKYDRVKRIELLAPKPTNKRLLENRALERLLACPFFKQNTERKQASEEEEKEKRTYQKRIPIL